MSVVSGFLRNQSACSILLLKPTVSEFQMHNFLKSSCVFTSIFILQSIFGSLLATPLNLTKEQAVAHALQYNPALKAMRTTCDQALGRLQQVGKWQNPSLNFSYATDQHFNNEGESNYSVGVEQSFPVTRRLSIQKQIALSEVELVQLKIDNRIRSTEYEVESLFVSTVALEEQIKLRDERLELSREFVDLMQSRVATGEVSLLEANQVQIELYAIEKEKQALSNEFLSKKSELKQLIGANVDAEIALKHQLKLSESSPQLSELTSELLKEHPEYRIKKLLHQVSGKAVSLAKAERWADIAVSIFFAEERGVDEPVGLETDRFWGMGVSVPLPLLDRKRGLIQSSRARQQQIQHELEQVELKLRSEACAQKLRVESLYFQARAYGGNFFQMMSETLAEADNAYSLGQISLAELFRLQEQSLRLQSAQLTALRDFELAMIDWKAATAKNNNNE